MRYANVNGERAAAMQGLAGTCPACGSPVVPKCGSLRAHHWAHRGKRSCDSWWEPLTEWHRAWQDRFPEDWRERICYSTSGEKHIADIQTPQGLTIEFQHSHISAEERRARELYYDNMVWVVNGARLKRDFPRFREGAARLGKTPWKGVFTTPFPEEAFPRTWLNCSTPVFFDFNSAELVTHQDVHLARLLWCLLPGRVLDTAVVLAMEFPELIRGAQTGPTLFTVENVRNAVGDYLARQARARSTKRMQWHRRRRTPRF